MRAADRAHVTGRRLSALGIAPPAGSRGEVTVHDIVRVHGAMQAQDHAGVLWSVGLRTGHRVEAVEQALATGEVVRSWPMRGTLHLTAAEDAWWMADLLAGRAIARAATRFRQLELTDEVLGRARELVGEALVGGRALSRPRLFDLLRDNGIAPEGQRGIHLLGRLSQVGMLCQGPPDGRQPTFVLLDEWVPHRLRPSREEAMATLAERYVRSHGPATERDFAGWTGETLGFAREALGLLGARLVREQVDGTEMLSHVESPPSAPRPGVRLLPGFDEYLLGYKDRSAALRPDHARLTVPGGNGMFIPTVVASGEVVGLWRRTTRTRQVDVTVTPFDEPSARRARAVEGAAAAYGRFLGLPVRVRWTAPQPH